MSETRGQASELKVTLSKGLPRVVRATCVKIRKVSKPPIKSAALVPPNHMCHCRAGILLFH